MESTLGTKYIHSLEQRLALLDQQRQEVAVLRRACESAGITLHALPRMEIVSLHSIMDSNRDVIMDSSLGSNNSTGSTLPSTAKSQPPSLTPWNVIFRKLYPDQISHLRQHQRSLIDTIVLNDYLIPRFGSEAATTCLIHSSVGTNSFYGIPADLVEPFKDWIVIKMEQVSKMDEFSMSNKRRKSAPASRENTSHGPTSLPISPVLPNEEILPTASEILPIATAKPKPQRPFTSASSFVSVLTVAKRRADLGRLYTPDFLHYSSTMNRDGYPAWVDVIRGRYPTFNRPNVHMCTTASRYLMKHGMIRVDFLNTWNPLSQSGMFGDAHMHGKLNDSAENEGKENKEDEQTESHDASNALPTKLHSESLSAKSSEKSENNISEDEVMPVSDRARERRTLENPSRDILNPESAAPLLADRDWKLALNDGQRLYLAEQAKATKLLLRVRNQTYNF
ncbi:hypothetical protein HDU81_002255 [Chytriomyces hyalinus]|nr:hypothetical protein HDU81_002255 [Chytriomyces hyalinus]